MYKKVSPIWGSTMRKFLLLACMASLLGTAGVALADPNLTLQAEPHRHFVNGVEVGPRYCDNPGLRDAFAQFHANTHTHNGVTGEIGPVAPGLHNSRGGELTFSAC
jgi:hypothetical protein